jgi:LysM repeat protein
MVVALFGFLQAMTQGNLPKLTPIEGRFIVLLDSTVERRVVKVPKRMKTPQFKATAKRNEAVSRNTKTANIMAFMRKAGLADDEIESVFVDAGVGVVIKNVSAELLKKLRNTSGVTSVVKDFSIQMVDPIMQSDPIMQGVDPIMQSDPIMQLFSDPIMQVDPIMQSRALDIDTSKRAPIAVVRAGGPLAASSAENVIWVLDTGVDPSHPNLNVEQDTALAKSFAPGEPFIADSNGHGTHCAGIAAGKNLGNGVVGVSPGAKIVPVKVLNAQGTGTWSSIIEGLNHVSIHAIQGDVVNMSFGASDASFSEGTNPLLTSAITGLGKQGLFVVMSGGNNASNANLNLPGLINGTNLFTVAAMEKSNEMAFYSNFGIPPIDFIVIGSRVLSTWKHGQFRMLSGTSMAAGVMSGILHASNGKMPASAGQVRTETKGNYTIGVVNR